MSDGTIYNDQRGPLDLSTAAREQELFYCEFTQEQIEQIRTAFGGDLQKLGWEEVASFLEEQPDDWSEVFGSSQSLEA